MRAEVKSLGPYLILASLLVLPWACPAYGHDAHFEVDGTVGYRIGGARRVDRTSEGGALDEGRLNAAGAPSFGAIVGYRVETRGFVFVSYSRQQTTFTFAPTVFDRATASGRVSIEYFQFGGTLQDTIGSMTPYLGLSVGATRFSSLDASRATARLSTVMEGGVKIDILPFAHLRILARLPFTFASGEFFCDSSGGCMEALRFSPFVQGEGHVGLGLHF